MKHIRKLTILLMLLVFFIVGCSKEVNEDGVLEEPDNSVEVEDPIVEPEPEPEPELEPVTEIVEVTLSAAGDVTMGNYLGQGYENSYNYTYDTLQDYSYFFQNVKPIFESDDFTLVNLEGVLTNSEDAAPGRDFSIKGDPFYVNILVEGDIDGVSMENNHRRDFGEQGTTDTVAALESVDIPYAYEEFIGREEVKGITIGWVSVCPASWGATVEPVLQAGIEKLKEENTDLIIACCHWGIERENYPIDYQRELGKRCIDWGVDVVIGCHPHVLQGLEEYNGKMIVYSLGNFSFGANKNPDDKDTMIYQQVFKFEKTTDPDGTVTIQQIDDLDANIIPCSISSVTERNDYCPTPLTGEEGQRVIDRVNDFSNYLGVYIEENGEITWMTDKENE